MKKEQKLCIAVLIISFTICAVTLAATIFPKTASSATSSKASIQTAPSVSSEIQPASPSASPLSAPQKTNAAAISDSSSPLKVKVTASNNWQENGLAMTQLDGSLNNTSDNTIKNWTVTFELPSGSKVRQSWNGNYSISNNKVTITPVSYNTEIPPHSSIDFGCILSASEVIQPAHVKVTCSTAAGQNSSTVSNTTTPASDNTPASVSSSPLEKVSLTSAEKAKIAKEGDWLYVKGNKIVDKTGQQVWLTGINWFGYNTGTNTFDGLWNSNLDDSIASIADHGFNLLRVPISTELILSWKKGIYPTANFNHALNSHLVSKNSLEIFDYVLATCKKNGLKVMIDIHCAETNAMGHNVNLWYTDKISESDYLAALSYMANRYAKDDTIIAYDLKNEPHGKPNEANKAIWNNSKAPNNWKYTAEKAAQAVLKENPNVLIMVEGIEIYPKNIKKNGNFSSQNSDDYYFNWWGGNLRGVKDYPINLGQYQNKLVYSPHDYGPGVYKQPWFKSGYTYESLYKDCWKDNWMYIYENNTAPLLIGEWGGYMTEPNLTWMKYLRQLIIKNKLHHTFWCYNANSGDTGGLVNDDFKTWNTQKYNFVKEALWQKNGKFVGLDQETPLGRNGISLQQYKN